MMRIEVLGIYPIEAREPCALVEVVIRDDDDQIDLAEVTQEVAEQPRANWQVPYDEFILNQDGTAGEPNYSTSPLSVRGSLRLAFFFHYLDISRPLLTPAGEVNLPSPTAFPSRLDFIQYDPPS